MNLSNRRGAVLVLAALIMVAVFDILVIVVDISRIYVQKSELQTAADAGALAGVMELPKAPLPPWCKTALGPMGRQTRLWGKRFR